ncbi:MAG: ABC transporter permease, partial [Caldilineaceae bacterium]
MATVASTTPAPMPSKQVSWLEILSKVWSVLFLILICIFFAFQNPTAFLSATNFQNILAGMAILAIIAFGQTYVIISGGIDLSAGWIMGMVTVVAAITMNALAGAYPLWLVVLAGLATGLVVAWIAGLVNGVLVAYLNIPP